jgi:hypothetical protein
VWSFIGNYNAAMQTIDECLRAGESDPLTFEGRERQYQRFIESIRPKQQTKTFSVFQSIGFTKLPNPHQKTRHRAVKESADSPGILSRKQSSSG